VGKLRHDGEEGGDSAVSVRQSQWQDQDPPCPPTSWYPAPILFLVVLALAADIEKLFGSGLRGGGTPPAFYILARRRPR